MNNLGIHRFYDKMDYLTQQGLYAVEIMQTYTKPELEQAADFMRTERDKLFPYSGLELLTKRYVIHDRVAR